ncbi:MAG: DNA polymerase III subunit gamma/tau [Prevotella sp.]
MGEYIVSARKYRPHSFDTVVGQAALTATLRNAVKSGKLAHAYLFCGPRGVGKTTCARIFAKAINCEHPTPDGEACRECESCKAFAEQRSYNIFELDAASNNSVEHIKTLMEQTRVPPQVGKYKVFIIDEVHMLSTAAFNAFLKTLEEPPSHVIFILATTEKHKILPTILSRCQIYDFERMTVGNIIDHLKKVATQEGITYEEEALAVIAEKADGGMRDALSVFDQTNSFCQGNITYQKVIEDLNVLDADNYFKMIDLSYENKVSDIMVLLNTLINKGFDGGLLVNGLAKHVRNVLMAKDESTLPLLEASNAMRQRYKEQAAKCSTPFLYQALKIMNQCDINYRQSSNKRLLVELTLIEVAQITQVDDSTVSGRRPKRLKSLFKKSMSNPQQARRVPQVAPAEQRHDATPAVSARSLLNEGSTANKPKPMNIKMGALSNSWQNIKLASTQKKSVLIPGTLDKDRPDAKAQDEHQTFTQADLELQWMSMCNRMPERLSGTATRMKNIIPQIVNFPHLRIMVENQIMMEQLQAIQGSIVNTLRLHLHNVEITLDMQLATHKGPTRILSRREQFEEMEKENPAVGKLKQLFDLELA